MDIPDMQAAVRLTARLPERGIGGFDLVVTYNSLMDIPDMQAAVRLTARLPERGMMLGDMAVDEPDARLRPVGQQIEWRTIGLHSGEDAREGRSRARDELRPWRGIHKEV
jgi:hypothetical protein